MIISRFNRYVEKHGRVTYIVLGIIICFMFVIFVGNGNEFASGCSNRSYGGKVAKVYNRKIDLEEFMMYKNQAYLTLFLRVGEYASQISDDYLNYETLNRIRMVHEAKKGGYIAKVTDKEVAKQIQDMVWFQDDNGKFSLEKFGNFKNYFLARNGMRASDFDNMVRDNLAIQNMFDAMTKDIQVTEKEIDDELASFTLNYTNIPLEMDKVQVADDKEIADFFANRKADIKLDKLRSAVVAYYKMADVMALAAKAQAPAELKVTEDEIKKSYESGKDSMYKGKEYAAVKVQISSMLTANKARAFARKQANTMVKNAKTAIEKLDDAAAVAKFTELAKTAGATVVSTGFIEDGSKINGLEGDRAQLANAIRTLDKKAALTNVIFEHGSFAVAMLADLKDATMPETLTPAVTRKITESILEEKALKFYNEKVAPYKAKAANCKDASALAQDELAAIAEDETLSSTEKNSRRIKAMDYNRETVQPFFRHEERAFTLLTFNPAGYEAGVTLTENDIKKGFDARKEEYGKVEARLSMIMVKAAEDEAGKAAKKARADEAYKKLADGADFASVVKEYSEDDNTKSKDGDTGLINVNYMDAAIREQLDKMQINQLSTVVETSRGYFIFKLLEKTSPKTLEQVRPELIKTLTAEAARKMANVDAESLAQAFAREWNAIGHKADKLDDIIKQQAASFNATLQEIPMTRENVYGAKGPVADRKLMAAVFEASNDEPFTKVVDGTDAVYIACLRGTTAAYIEAADKAMSTLKSVYRRFVANQIGAQKAADEVARINAALKEGKTLEEAAKPLVFKAAASKFSKAEQSMFREFYVSDPNGMLAALNEAPAKSIIAPIKNYQGYELVYAAERLVPTGDAGKPARDNAREQLLNEKKQSILSAFITKSERESKTEFYGKEQTRR